METMNCKLCGGGRPENILRSQDSGIMKCPDCGFIYREPYRGCAAARCAPAPTGASTGLPNPASWSSPARGRRRAKRIERLAGGDLANVLELGAGLGAWLRTWPRPATTASNPRRSFTAPKANFRDLAESGERHAPGPSTAAASTCLLVDVLSS